MIDRRPLIACVLAMISIAMVTAKGKECGDNPMKQVLLVAKRTGHTLDHVLTVLRDIDEPAYEILARKFRMYAACVGLVDTGYFRKRSQPSALSQELTPQRDYDFSAINSGPNIQKRFSDILAFPAHSKNWDELSDEYDVLYKKSVSPGASTALVSHDFDGQLFDDADDISRTVLSIYTKAKQIIDAEKARYRFLGLHDDGNARNDLLYDNMYTTRN